MFRIFCIVISLILISSYVNHVHAGVVQCPDMTIDRIIIQGDRVDDFVLEKKLLLLLSAECSGFRYVYVNEGNPTYSAFLSMALTAYAQGKKIGININEGKVVDSSNELASMWVQRN